MIINMCVNEDSEVVEVMTQTGKLKVVSLVSYPSLGETS